jgi:uncharacterized protein YdhG (YjbR/CyaY superfamily)
MKIQANSPDQYLENVPEDRKSPIAQLRKAILDNLPEGFEETMSYGTIGYVVPHTMYPAGYHCDPKLPLPFINLASQKNFVALYHMGIYTDPDLLTWFQNNWDANVCGKLDMGKSCIRFKKMDRIPFDLIGQLVTKMSVADWVAQYEAAYVKKKKKK